MPSFRNIALSAAAAGVAMAETHIVKVGDGGLTFDPKMTTAAIGDIVEFQFWPQNHSVVAGSMDAGCAPLDNIETEGFYSGFMPVSSGMGEDVFQVEITSEDPWVYYCSQAKHCNNGMWGMINGDDDMAESYKALVQAATTNESPSEAGPFGGTVTTASEASETSGEAESTETGESGAGTVAASFGASFAALAAAVLLA